MAVEYCISDQPVCTTAGVQLIQLGQVPRCHLRCMSAAVIIRRFAPVGRLRLAPIGEIASPGCDLNHQVVHGDTAKDSNKRACWERGMNGQRRHFLVRRGERGERGETLPRGVHMGTRQTIHKHTHTPFTPQQQQQPGASDIFAILKPLAGSSGSSRTA